MSVATYPVSEERLDDRRFRETGSLNRIVP